MLKRLRRKRQRLRQLKQHLQRHLQLQVQHLRPQPFLVLEIIHSQQVAQFHAHLVLEIILSQPVVQFHVHQHNDQEHLVQEWQELVQVLSVQVLQRVLAHHVQQVPEPEQVITHHVQVAHHHRAHTVHKVPVVQQLVVHNVQAAVVLIAVQVVAAQQVHSERMQVNLRSVSRSHARRYAKNSTICRHHNLVEQLFLTVMERQRFVCAAVHRLLTLPRRSVQTQQR